ncbi:S46 family peptidase [Flavitalea sp. BT771]|uniref:S46 family peptidase n=2 Tax=Flavitalea sp. BT771 TaxID=3063329 RepID=UPI0026E1C2E2|nr:S46 family peptidase [Flavitalea sp. BT771]MDO6433582.1 S46 family peptidase [Flavitalea sp. BT771]MDV6222513.1 S46 family peptidase [Flavitalea sp. BT771]
MIYPKRILLTIVLSTTLLRSMADEGMWLPLLLGEQVYGDMVKKGLKLTKEQLYSINKASLKDAIIIFGRGCTGEIVSNDGLIFTNHHCGYDAIASSSSIEHNYLRDGFYAKSRQEEIPARGLTADFLLKIEDVTKEVEDSLKGLAGDERATRQQSVLTSINNRFTDVQKSITGRISPLFKGNQFLVFVYQRYSDIRLVGTPPESIGKFGGDTDNWEWPRHTGDFSIFRIYAGKNGEPSEYSTDDVPLKPKYFLPVSIKGLKDGDYAMIYGYPGSTNRYETSFGVKQKIDVDNPTLVKLRDIRLKYMFEEMKKDPAVKLQLASSYASIANYWKFFDGESKQLIKYGIYDQKKAQEAAFQQWAEAHTGYDHLFKDWAKAYEDWRPYSRHRVYMNEGILGSPLIAFAASLQELEYTLVKPGYGDLKKALQAAGEARKNFVKQENKPSDQHILAAITQSYYTDIDKSQQPIGFYEAIRSSYGPLQEDATYQKYAAAVFAGTFLFDDARWNAFVNRPEANLLQEDPAYKHAAAFLRNWQGKYLSFYQQFNSRNNELGRLYLKGIIEKDPKKVRYPDATFTMRVSYGNVKSYSPRDAVHYDYVTTLSGVLEKYVPGDYEFDLPPGLVEHAKKKDFGQYVDKQRNDLVVGFITTNDITGGNSGSPVLNANGELIGLAFDGNYEALSHKIAFDAQYNRTICVDIRYVLWCIDKLGGAPNIINELKLVRPVASVR